MDHSRQPRIGWLLFGGLLLITVAFVGLNSQGVTNALSSVRSAGITPTQSAPIQSGVNVRVAPTISLGEVRSVLCDNGSPACGYAAILYNEGARTNLNPAFILAVFQKESHFGETGVAPSTKNPGNIKCLGHDATYQGISFTCVGIWTKFATWRDGILALYRLFNSPMYQGRNTVEAIIQKASPPSENATATYIADVEQSMASWQGK